MVRGRELGDAVEAMSLGHIVEGFAGEGCQKNLALKSKKMLKGFNRGVIHSDLYVLNFYSGFTVENTKSKDSQYEVKRSRDAPKKSTDTIQGVRYLEWEKITWPSHLKK